MNRNFNPTSTWTRFASAAAAMVMTTIIAVSIGGLAQHYSSGWQMASVKSFPVAMK